MITGNKGEWSEPYALLKLLSEGKLYIGDENFNQVKEIFYPILKVIRHEKDRNVEFTIEDNLIIVSDNEVIVKLPIIKFIENTRICFEKIKTEKGKKGAFGIPEIETFLASFSINTLKAKSKLKNDLTIQINDPNTFLSPVLGFSVKSQLGQPSTLLNASGVTNFTYCLKGNKLSNNEIERVNNTRFFSDKMALLSSYDVLVEFEKIENPIFHSNLQTIDYYFDRVLSEIVLLYYSSNIPQEYSIKNLIGKITEKNPLNYNLAINPHMYELMAKKFLTDYALGMRAGEVWKRNYQATGGYLIVREDGELLCYHFYFAQQFEEYLFANTRLETPDPNKIKFGFIYEENDQQKIKLSLQIRFIK